MITRRYLWPPVPGLLAVALLAACAGVASPVQAPMTVGEGRPSESVVDVGYNRIAEVYVDPIDLGVLTVDALDGLATLDDEISARRRGDVVELLAGGNVVGRYTAPAADDAEGWAALTLAAVDRGRTASTAIGDASTEDINKALFSAIAQDLDPYSRYVDPENAARERAYRDGYGGIGLLLDTDDDGRPIIQEVFRDGPAFEANLQSGMRIVAVDGTPTSGWSLETLGETLRGPVGTLVAITVRDTAGQDRRLELRRQRVIPNVVSTRYENGIAILKVSRFNAATADNLVAALDEAVTRVGPSGHGLILDLRGNPGGLLDQSVEVADLFIARGEIIHTRGRHPDSQQRFIARSDDHANGLRMVVLIDGRSASGAEVVAAALQDSARAVLVGASSYGKGSVQTVTRLPNDGELFLTWSRIFAPSGYTLNEQGVMPTVCTSVAINTADGLIQAYRQGNLPTPASLAATRRAAPADPTALASLREACPWREHEAELDVQVAMALLRDRELYDQAIDAWGRSTIASR